MAQIDTSYVGFYARFDSPDKPTGSLLMGPDNIVGDDYEVFFKQEDDRNIAWIKNKFGAECGFFDADVSRKLQLAFAREQKVRAILSFVAYSDEPDPGLYWGEVGIFCYNPAFELEMGSFVNRCAALIGDGKRPNIDFGRTGLEKLFDNPEWVPSDTVPFPNKEVGMAILKDRQSISEKLIEQGRARNKGCYVVSWAFIIAVIALVLYGIHTLGLF